MVRRPPVSCSLLGLLGVYSPCLAAPFASGAPVSHRPGLSEAVPCGRRGAAGPVLGGGVGAGSAALPHSWGPCPLAPTAQWAARTAVEHLQGEHQRLALRCGVRAGQLELLLVGAAGLAAAAVGLRLARGDGRAAKGRGRGPGSGPLHREQVLPGLPDHSREKGGS